MDRANTYVFNILINRLDVWNLAEKNQLIKIRNSLERHVGDKVRLTAKIGRKNILIRKGVIDSIYPSVFTVRLADDNKGSRISYSYIDVLTKAVEIQFYRRQNEA